MSNKMIAYTVGAFLALLVGYIVKPFVMIGTGHRGIVVEFGAVQDKVLREGLQWRVPILQKIIEVDTRSQIITYKATAYSKDIQSVDTAISINYHLNPETVNRLYQEVGPEYRERIIDPAIQESVKAAMAQFTAQELVEQRPKLKDEIKVQLTSRFEGRHIVVEDFSIVNFDFSDSYEQAVESKQVAQQNALKAENELRRIEIEAKQQIATAQAQAESIRIQAQAIQQQGGREFVNMKAIEKWDGRLPTQMIPGSTVPFLALNHGNVK